MTRSPEPEILNWTQLQEGLLVEHDFSFSADDLDTFAELSGDFNPLHRDRTFARAQGFEDVVVYGGLLVARVSEVIGMRLPGRNAVWASLSIRFVKPLYVKEPARLDAEIIEASEAASMIVLSIRISTETKLVAEGKAEVVIGNGRP